MDAMSKLFEMLMGKLKHFYGKKEKKKKKFETASTDASESGDAGGASYLFGAGAI